MLLFIHVDYGSLICYLKLILDLVGYYDVMRLGWKL